MNIENTYLSLRRRLKEITGSEGEATAMARLIFHALKGWSTTDLVIHYSDTAGEFLTGRIREILGKLQEGEPIQYILGEARFYGMTLKVTPATLIPRPETEELVEIIVRENAERRGLRVLDVGCGSGAIAIALSRNLLFPEVTAIDISREAADVARENARMLHARIDVLQEDIFSYRTDARSLDIIVSNPPYVMESERSGMERHVLEHEPATALFVPDDDPLRYYRRIGLTGKEALRECGRLYFEINPLCAADLASLLREQGYRDVRILRDISGKERFATCSL